MITEELKQEIIDDYTSILDGTNPLLSMPYDNIEEYISGLWWDLIDEIDNIRDSFGIDKKTEPTAAAHAVENIIRRTLTEYYYNKV